MYVNKSKALSIAIEAIKQLPYSDENEQAIKRLKTLGEMTMNRHWTKETIFQALNQWRDEHGRNPTVTNLVEYGMPKAVTIQRMFDMKASAFMSIYYPSEQTKKPVTKYSVRTEQEWINDFRRQYEQMKPKSGREYNNRREEGSPTWNTIIKYCHVGTWTELLKITNVDISHLHKTPPIKTLTVISEHPTYDRLIELLEDRKKELSEMFNIDDIHYDI